MSKFKPTVPIQEVPFRQNLEPSWDPSRTAQLKAFLAHMRTAVDNSLGAQVLQSPTRIFSEFVPKIPRQDIFTERSYREIRIRFTPPRGLRKFLLYEFQVAQSENFNSFDTFPTPEPFLTFSSLTPGTTYYFRMRVVTTDREVGPWSDTVAVTALKALASSLFTNITYHFTSSFVNYDEHPANNFQDVFEVTHDGIGGVLFYLVSYNIESLDTQTTNNLAWQETEFRWLENGVQVGQNFQVTSYNWEENSTLGNFLSGTSAYGPFDFEGPFEVNRRGTFVQKLHQVIEGDIVITLQAKQLPFSAGPGSWTEDLNPANTVLAGQCGYALELKNFSSMELIFEA